MLQEYQKTNTGVRLLLAIALVFALASHRASAELTPHKVFLSENRKNQLYLADGLVLGGEPSKQPIVLKDIRHARNVGYERMVFEFETQENGAPLSLSRPPYFQVAIHAEENRLLVTFWGNPQLQFHSARVAQLFRQSGIIRNLQLLPKVEDDRWTVALELQPHSAVEVFELKDPARVILDLQKKNPKAPIPISHALQ
jgi:hypothetical protein